MAKKLKLGSKMKTVPLSKPSYMDLVEDAVLHRPVYWVGDIGPGDDFGMPIHDEFVDGVMKIGGKWAIMCPESWEFHGCGRLGTGSGQRYVKQADGRWLKVEG